MNLLKGIAASGQIRAGDLHFRLPGVPDGEIVVGLRPEALRVRGAEREPALSVRVDVVEALGHEIVMHASIAGRQGSPDDEAAALSPLESERATLFVRLGAGEHLAVGGMVEVRFSLDDVHVFDATTGAAIPAGPARDRAAG